MTGHPSRRRSGALRLAAAAAAALALAGCQLRLETPPPAEPSPDAAEQARARAVDQADTLRQAAVSATDRAEAAAAAVLHDVAAFSQSHSDALGGVYDSGLPTPSPTATESPAPPPAASPDDVLAGLREASASALADADQVADGAMARLLAEVGTARGDLAARLAAALGEPASDEVAAPPGESPDSLPAGMAVAAAATLVLAHDQAGYAYEVVAAKSADDARAAAVASAAAHRAAATSWAERAGIAGTATDPRRAAYALPAGLDDPAAQAELAASLESAVAEAASAAIPGVTAGARGELIDLLVAATAAARGRGAPPTAFPGESDAAPVHTPAPDGGATGGPPRWPPVDAGPLPTHLPQDTGPRSGAAGEATAEADGSFTYVVAGGDVLGAIGLRFFPDDSMTASVTLLQAVNAGTIVGEAIKDGDRITVPNGRYTASG